jgi:hypothetical protein
MTNVKRSTNSDAGASPFPLSAESAGGVAYIAAASDPRALAPPETDSERLDREEQERADARLDPRQTSLLP